MKIALVVFIVTFIVAGNIGYYQAEKKIQNKYILITK